MTRREWLGVIAGAVVAPYLPVPTRVSRVRWKPVQFRGVPLVWDAHCPSGFCYTVGAITPAEFTFWRNREEATL